MDAQVWNEAAYASQGFAAQRLYPNEELLRFMGRNFFGIPVEDRKTIKILEAGCGSGANLWMIAREGFDAYGIDYAPSAVHLCQQMLHRWKTTADVQTGNMTAIPHEDGMFDAVLDVFSAYCLTEAKFDAFLSETARVLKPGGKFFSYTPSKRSDAFTNHAPALLIDGSTLNGIHRESSPYSGSDHAFRFISQTEYFAALARHGLTPTYGETVSRTYREGAEYFEFIVVEAHR